MQQIKGKTANVSDFICCSTEANKWQNTQTLALITTNALMTATNTRYAQSTLKQSTVYNTITSCVLTIHLQSTMVSDIQAVFSKQFITPCIKHAYMTLHNKQSMDCEAQLA